MANGDIIAMALFPLPASNNLPRILHVLSQHRAYNHLNILSLSRFLNTIHYVAAL